MTPERWQAVKELFNAVRDLDPGERETLLARTAPRDPELIAEVRKLLESFDEAGDFIETPLFEGGGRDAGFQARFAPGATVGPYRIVDTLGMGGMGAVYLAEQEAPVARRVALKVIRPGLISPKILARFDSERRALAMMDHPNIARIYHADTTPEGFPYFAMEYVPGEHLTRYCDRHRLGLEERITLFLQVCRAVAHAHRKGIVHRDLKPSNILVTDGEEGRTIKIIDFGIVKATDHKLTEETLTTHSGLVLGTLAYVSPEQAGVTEDPVESYSDVYALGIVLYELLTGQSPFATPPGIPFHEALIRIRDLVPESPSAFYGSGKHEAAEAAGCRGNSPVRLAEWLRGGLDEVVAKAIQKRPENRYRQVGELTRALELCLAHDTPEETTDGRRAGPPPSAAVDRPRPQSPLWLTAAALVALAIAGTGWWRAESANRLLLEERRIVVRADEIAEAADLAVYKTPVEAGSLRGRLAEEVASLEVRAGGIESDRLTRALARCHESLGAWSRAARMIAALESSEHRLLGYLEMQAWVTDTRLSLLLPDQAFLAARADLERRRTAATDALELVEGFRRPGDLVPALAALARGDDDRDLELALQATGARTDGKAWLLVGDLHALHAADLIERGDEESGAVLDRARIAYSRAEERAPGDPAPLLRQAWVSLLEHRRGDVGESVTEDIERLITRAERLQPGHPEARFLRAALTGRADALPDH